MLSEVTYDGELSGVAYLILSITILVIVGGLGWCFYRAVKAGAASSEEQLPDDESSSRDS